MIPVDEELDLKKRPLRPKKKICRNDKIKRAFTPDGIYSRRLFTHRNEKSSLKPLPTKRQSSLTTIYFSGGRVGSQVEMSPENLLKAVDIVLPIL